MEKQTLEKQTLENIVSTMKERIRTNSFNKHNEETNMKVDEEEVGFYS